jgi:hypothetical protein
MFCTKLGSWNIHIEVLIGQSYNRHNKGEKDKRGGHQSDEVAAEFWGKSICPTRKS